jgi:hypothetical protein
MRYVFYCRQFYNRLATDGQTRFAQYHAVRSPKQPSIVRLVRAAWWRYRAVAAGKSIKRFPTTIRQVVA